MKGESVRKAGGPGDGYLVRSKETGKVLSHHWTKTEANRAAGKPVKAAAAPRPTGKR